MNPRCVPRRNPRISAGDITKKPNCCPAYTASFYASEKLIWVTKRTILLNRGGEILAKLDVT